MPMPQYGIGDPMNQARIKKPPVSGAPGGINLAPPPKVGALPQPSQYTGPVKSPAAPGMGMGAPVPMGKPLTPVTGGPTGMGAQLPAPGATGPGASMQGRSYGMPGAPTGGPTGMGAQLPAPGATHLDPLKGRSDYGPGNDIYTPPPPPQIATENNYVNSQTGESGTTPPPGPQSGALPQTPPPTGQPMSAFDLAHNLINQQINPMGTNREQLAQDYFKNMMAQGQPEFQKNIRDITQRSAAGGRLGSGMYGSNLVDAATQYQNNMANQAANLAYTGGSAQIGDQQDNERALRGERGYQYALSQDATQQAVQQKLIEDQLLNSGFNRDQQQIGNMINVGFNGNPSGAVLGAAGQTQAAASQGGANLNDMLYQYLQHRNTQPPAGG